MTITAKEMIEKQEKEKISDAVNAASEDIKKLQDAGFLPMNPPVADSEKKAILSKKMATVKAVKSADKNMLISAEVVSRQKELDSLFRDCAKNFLKIGYNLYLFTKDKAYKELGYKQFDDFCRSEYGIGRSAAYNFIKVCTKYSIKDETGEPTPVLGRQYAKYTSSQLVEMLSLDESAIAQIDADKTVKEIRAELKAAKKSAVCESSDSDENSAGDDMQVKDVKPKKVAVRDVNVPVYRLQMASGKTWEQVLTDKVKKACEFYLNDERRDADKKDYSIEISITYPDISV